MKELPTLMHSPSTSVEPDNSDISAEGVHTSLYLCKTPYKTKDRSDLNYCVHKGYGESQNDIQLT